MSKRKAPPPNPRILALEMAAAWRDNDSSLVEKAKALRKALGDDALGAFLAAARQARPTLADFDRPGTEWGNA